ncbi:transporter substrate-binding domain-containing protein [Labrys wisconsinensis]|uniref:Polar amino acid transport system substrate-binding protein n=1 Tax=Labrys wisconsinensis TaxID=425677 RepID=A0ABU0JHL5_9HYPH|nr:transporter substrate-binding domain-containing protein [Labrys wisconsinensis]MDQ0473764.1 polar amino acid transport system substrate-binding protein [Labrys wisconsinensis]
MRLLRAIAAALPALLFAAGGAGSELRSSIRVASEGGNPPFNTVDADGRLAGFDIDIAQALCDRMKVTCSYVQVKWEDLIPGLLAGRFDAIAADMSITAERRRLVAFTDRYSAMPGTFAIRTGDDIGDASPAALRGKVLGAQAGTTAAAYLQQRYKSSRVRLFDTQAELEAALAAGRIHALLADKFTIYGWLQRAESGGCCRFAGVELPDVNPDGEGIAVRKEDDGLRTRLNQALRAIKADGTYKAITAKYFPFSIE